MVDSFRFPRVFRLSDSAAFKQTIRSCDHKQVTRFFIIYWRKNGLPYPRMGLVFGKKKLRRAVDRQRLKRMLRERFRHCSSKLAGEDVVVILRSTMNKACFPALKQSVKNLWSD